MVRKILFFLKINGQRLLRGCEAGLTYALAFVEVRFGICEAIEVMERYNSVGEN